MKGRSMTMTYHRRIVKVLSDGQWQSLRDMHRDVARFIDAQTADREFHKRHPAWEDHEPKARVAQGRKRLVLLALLTLVHHRRRAETGRGRDRERQHRLAPKALETRVAAKK